jgi:hypothetical protein
VSFDLWVSFFAGFGFRDQHLPVACGAAVDLSVGGEDLNDLRFARLGASACSAPRRIAVDDIRNHKRQKQEQPEQVVGVLSFGQPIQLFAHERFHGFVFLGDKT